MDLKPCKYSIIRYIPDSTLGELFNVGVILHSWEPFFLKMRFNATRVRKEYKGIELFDLNFLMGHIEKQFEMARPEATEIQTNVRYGDPDFLTAFTKLFQDTVILSEPKTTLAGDLEEEFRDLFKTYVRAEVDGQVEAQPKRFVTRVLNRFREAGIEDRIEKGVKVDVDVIQKVQFGYQNGLPNLIQPIPLNSSLQTNLEKAAFWNIAVHEIRDKSEKYGRSPFYAVVMPPKDPQKQGFQTACEVLQQHFEGQDRELLKVINFESREMDFLIHKIQRTAH